MKKSIVLILLALMCSIAVQSQDIKFTLRKAQFTQPTRATVGTGTNAKERVNVPSSATFVN